MDREYVLGTHDEEIERLGVQHLVWRPVMLEAWRRAGITRGSRVVDVGAGPGWATADLADIVGASGFVLGVERSARFVAAARQRCAERRAAPARIDEADLIADGIGAGPFDVAWCRWVASFVQSPEALVAAIAGALQPGGVALFHEYGDYASWRLLPPRVSFAEFVGAVMASWRGAGGEPDVALRLPALLRAAGFRIVDLRPLVFTATPPDFVWQWPATFFESGLNRLVEIGVVHPARAEAMRADFAAAARDRETVMLTPLVLEIRAVRES
jgi:SAM-dependent methyltransferase